MRIGVIVKHVPDSRVSVRVNADGSALEQDGLKFVCDPFDEIAVEQAVQIKASRSDVQEIVVMTVGRAAAAESLRHALAMGADRAVHVLCEDIQPHEEMRAAKLCAEAIRKLAAEGGAFDLILCGARTTDNGAGEFGPALAEYLDLPHAGAMTKMALEGSLARVHCRVGASNGGAESVFEVQLPVLMTCERGLVEPRHPALPKLMKAKQQPIHAMNPSAGGERCDATLVQLAPPRARQACRMIEGDAAQMARELVRLLREEAKAL